MRFFRLGAALSLIATLLVLSSTAASADAVQTYLVLYKQQAVPADAARAIAGAGGTLVYGYDAIGVAVARSGSASFQTAIRKDSRVEEVAATTGLAVRVRDDALDADGQGPPPGSLPNAPAGDADSFSPLQWDMRQISAPQAHAITGGSRAVIVGDIDTGLDFSHPDLAPNYDAANSADCLTGAPTLLLPGNDKNGHGTHPAGTIAAAANGIGIVGVAPNVRIAGIKAGNDEGFFFPEAVVCAFMWAGTHHLDVTNNSYFADPFLFNCHNDPVQQAIWKAEQRAIRFALSQGVTVVSAEGNFSDDLAHPTQDVTSPDFPPDTAVTRPVNNNCVVIPVEVAGVVGVTADGNKTMKSFYSNYGVGVTEVIAPGGDSMLQRTAEAPNGRVLSTYPATTFCRPDRRLVDPVEPTAVYCYLQGTSMASPHVAGVAALVISRFGDLRSPQNGKLRPGRVAAIMQQTADPIPCPTAAELALYAPFPSVSNDQPQRCQGGTGYNSWYGKGQVNALQAIR
ncbi:MAG TPA: S8 family serine peptidase [Chloroflexota bacterium]